MENGMKKLLLIMGDLATGKSTFAKLLSDRYHTVLFCKDPIKETLGNTFGFSNREENLRLSYATAELFYLILGEFAKQNVDLILESNFRIGELETIQKIAMDYGYKTLTLVLHGDIEVLHKRYLNRMHNENRAPVHLCEQFNTLEGFGKYIDSLRTATVPGDYIQIDANDFSYQTDRELLDKINCFMGD
jgi:predicted kinase